MHVPMSFVMCGTKKKFTKKAAFPIFSNFHINSRTPAARRRHSGSKRSALASKIRYHGFASRHFDLLPPKWRSLSPSPGPSPSPISRAHASTPLERKVYQTRGTRSIFHLASMNPLSHVSKVSALLFEPQCNCTIEPAVTLKKKMQSY